MKIAYKNVCLKFISKIGGLMIKTVRGINSEPKQQMVLLSGTYEGKTVKIFIGENWVEVDKEEIAEAVFCFRGKWG